MDIKELWVVLKDSTWEDKDIHRAFREKVTSNVCIELLEEIDKLEKGIKNTSTVKIGDFISYKHGNQFKKMGLVVYISSWMCVVKSRQGVDFCIDFSRIDNEICNICNSEG